MHGYDREAELAAGRPSTLSIGTDIPGVFEVELRPERAGPDPATREPVTGG
ncbi:hypothetical protein GCM10022224_056360 [Nonomuraea antimicrobica]|uniref:Uncharacterized protein n=1 Tax=Nonomuraea antimicrobica TaxID=561173 RepID=A0ABP7CCX9_9ACTN